MGRNRLRQVQKHGLKGQIADYFVRRPLRATAISLAPLAFGIGLYLTRLLLSGDPTPAPDDYITYYVPHPETANADTVCARVLPASYEAPLDAVASAPLTPTESGDLESRAADHMIRLRRGDPDLKFFDWFFDLLNRTLPRAGLPPSAHIEPTCTALYDIGPTEVNLKFNPQK